MRPATESGRALADVATRIDRQTVVIDVVFLRQYVLAIESEARFRALTDVMEAAMRPDFVVEWSPQDVADAVHIMRNER